MAEIDRKKIAAAMAAVDMFIESENWQAASAAKPEPMKSGWASYGRQQIMNDRAFLQSRLYK